MTHLETLPLSVLRNLKRDARAFGSDVLLDLVNAELRRRKRLTH